MSTTIQNMMQDMGKRAHSASRAMARASSEQKNQALLQIAKVVRQKADEIQAVNLIDVERAKVNGQDAAFIDRLTMTPKTIETPLIFNVDKNVDALPIFKLPPIFT